MTRTEKPCSVCKVVKPLTEFHRHCKMPDGHRYRCKSCTAAGRRWDTPEYRAYQREYARRRRQSDPEGMAAVTRRSYLKVHYGVSESTYREMLASQGGRCATCGTDEVGKRRAYFDVDHDHKTGRVRGLLCHPCNKALGFARDNPDVLRRLADYLEEPCPTAGQAMERQ